MTVIFAMVLDALFGEPKWLWSRVPHPAVVMGRLVAAGDHRWNTGTEPRRVVMGAVLVAGLIAGAACIAVILSWCPKWVSILLGAVLLAHRSLVDHVQAVAQGLNKNLAAGRWAVAQIVGRDTATLSDSDVARAAIESAAENFSDGVIAPLFWFVVLGPFGLLMYKLVNTADSMIGYRTARFEHFGKAAARCDDVLNWIPARLTALLIQLSFGQWPGLARLRDDAVHHRSPNAGWPEAAMAHGLGVALSGPRIYDGVRHDLPWVNGQARRRLWASDIDAAVRVLWKTWVISLGLVFAGVVFGWLI